MKKKEKSMKKKTLFCFIFFGQLYKKEAKLKTYIFLLNIKVDGLAEITKKINTQKYLKN